MASFNGENSSFGHRELIGDNRNRIRGRNNIEVLFIKNFWKIRYWKSRALDYYEGFWFVGFK